MRSLPIFRRLVQAAALVASAAAVAVVAGAAPASAAPAFKYKTPKVPIVVDGVHYAPQGIHKFDGRPLYFVVDLDRPKLLVGYTKMADYNAAVAAQEAEFRAAVRPTVAGQWGIFYTHDEMSGDWLQVNSGSSYSDLRAAGRCNIFHCWGDFDNVISSVHLNSTTTFFADQGFGGARLTLVGANQWGNMSWWGFDNIVSSVVVHW